MGRLRCIVNPAGRDGSTGKRWPDLRQRLTDAGWVVEERLTTGPGHAAELAHVVCDELEAGELVLAVGGDGTAHEVASGMRGSDLVLALLPVGSGNDLARCHGVPADNLDGCIGLLTSGVDRRVSALRLEGLAAPPTRGYPTPASHAWDGDGERDGTVVRWVFLASDTGVTSLTSRLKLTKGRWLRGELKYTWLGLQAIAAFRPPRVRVTVDDQPPVEGRLNTVVGTLAETFGGGYRVTPGSHPQQGGMSLLTVFGLGRLRMIRLMKPLWKGEHIGRWGIEQRLARRVHIDELDPAGEPISALGERPTYIQVDGEPCLCLPATLTWFDDQLTVRGARDVPWDRPSAEDE